MPFYVFALIGEEPARAVRGVEVVRVAGAWAAVARKAVPELTYRTAIAHDRSVRAIAKVCDAVLPLRFGMGAESERALAKKLAPFRASIREGLAHVHGAVQMTMRVGGREMKETARIAKATRGSGPGARFLGRKIAVHRVPEIDVLTDALRPYVRDTRIERLAVGESFASVYFLVPRDQLAGFRRVVLEEDGIARTTFLDVRARANATAARLHKLGNGTAAYSRAAGYSRLGSLRTVWFGPSRRPTHNSFGRSWFHARAHFSPSISRYSLFFRPAAHWFTVSEPCAPESNSS